MANLINRLNNVNIYANGASLLGKAKELELPELTQVTDENKPLGAIGTTEYFSGFEKMEAKIIWSSLYGDVMALIADPFKVHNLQVRGSLDQHDSSGAQTPKPVVIYLTARFKSVPFGSFKAMENVELETNLAVTAIKMEIDGRPIVEFDATAMIYKVEGRDILAAYRENIGA